jgi:hypothetical protein
VHVPPGATGKLVYELVNVTAYGNGLHGVVINDQADPTSMSDAGSAASIAVRVNQSRFERNGLAAGDQDGLRVNEGGDGSLDAVIRHTVVVDNGGDGIELDERGRGDVLFDISHTQFLRNGPFDPNDLDDGLDIDEAQDGHVVGRLVQVTANDNHEEGIDINENDAGDMRIAMVQVEASRNVEEGVDLEEDDDFQGGGDLVATLTGVTANGNRGGDAGIKIRERGDGTLVSVLEKAVALGNLGGAAGISLREDAAGDLDARISAATANGNEGHGIAFDENSDGNLAALLAASTSSSNGLLPALQSGVRAEQGGTGSGTLTVRALRADANTGGAISNDAGVVVER